MKKLIANEWYVLWKRKAIWLMFLAIPIMVYASAKYMLYQNSTTTANEPHYAVMGNFPILGLSEMLMTAFNFIIIAIATMVVTDEYRSGQLRMVLTRTYSFRQIIFAKFFVVMGLMFLYLLIYLISCYLMGYIMFSNPLIYPQFYDQGNITIIQGFIYNLKFYGFAYITLIAMGSVIFYLAIISHTTTTTIGVGIGFLFVSFMYPNVLQLFGGVISNEIVLKLFFTSIPTIQWQGLTLLLTQSSHLSIWIIFVLSCYILLFQLLMIHGTSLKKDIFI